MNPFRTVFYILGIIAILTWIICTLAYIPPRQEITKTGVQCEVYHGLSPSISCNWDAWNLKTNYGMYPEKAFDKVSK